jgi:hypothetical protein
MRWIKGVLGTFFGVGLLHAAQFCSLSFQACPGDFSGTITVPKEVIWIDPKVPVCDEKVTIQTGGPKVVPTSIMFVIDNSGSMNLQGVSNPSDPTNARFTVTEQLLDSIYAIAPGTQVGLSVFSRRLSFDDRDNPLFQTAFPGSGWHDAYVRLIPLDTTFANGKHGIDTLKALLTSAPVGGVDYGDLRYVTKHPNDRPHPGLDSLDARHGTDISMGFQGALQANKQSKAAKDHQFFVFLSDGAVADLDQGRAASANAFRDSVDNTPTTFTVFFDPNGGTNPPASIGNMTTNIQGNNYSGSNTLSAYYTVNQPATQLLALLKDKVLTPIFSNVPAQPKSASMQVGGNTYNNVSLDPKDFVFPNRVPLAENQTQIQFNYTYTYTDSNGQQKEKPFPYTLNIQRSNTSAYPANAVKTSCYDVPDIALYADGKPLGVVTADNDSVEVRVILPAGETCSNCHAGVTPSKSHDSESVTLSPSSGTISGILHRASSNSPSKLNGTLEHVPSDSIVVTYVNPDNPLEQVRESFPYNDIRTTLSAGPIQFDFDNQSRPVELPVTEQTHWIVAANPGIKLENSKPEQLKVMDPSLPEFKNDSTSSLSYPGVKIESSRSFRADIWVFTNMGDIVDKYSFNLPQIEFDKLPKGKQNTRILKLYWVPKAKNGRLAGTGAYIVRYTITLNKIPGIAEDEKVTTDVKILGYVRPKGS